jgi:hypothetical protein
MKMNIRKSIGKVVFLGIILSWVYIVDLEARQSNQRVPENYNLVYQQDFDDFRSVSDFVFSEPDSWSLRNSEGNAFLDYRESEMDKSGPEKRCIFTATRNN